MDVESGESKRRRSDGWRNRWVGNGNKLRLTKRQVPCSSVAGRNCYFQRLNLQLIILQWQVAWHAHIHPVLVQLTSSLHLIQAEQVQQKNNWPVITAAGFDKAGSRLAVKSTVLKHSKYRLQPGKVTHWPHTMFIHCSFYAGSPIWH